MLGYVFGKVLWKSDEGTTCIIAAGDVGYEITVGPNTFDRLLENQMATLWLHTYVREDQLTFYGFLSTQEKSFFRLLLSVSGLGPRHALSLLTEFDVSHLTQLILSKNIAGLSKAHGVGKKLAERMTLDLRSKLEKLDWVTKANFASPAMAAASEDPTVLLQEDLASALGNLGFGPQQVKVTLDRIFQSSDDSMGFEELFRVALKDLSGRSLLSTEGASNG